MKFCYLRVLDRPCILDRTDLKTWQVHSTKAFLLMDNHLKIYIYIYIYFYIIIFFSQFQFWRQGPVQLLDRVV